MLPHSRWRKGVGCASNPEGEHPCHRRTCPECGERWKRDQRRRLKENLEHYGEEIRTLTITAPGTPDYYLALPLHRKPSRRWIRRYAQAPHDVRARVAWNLAAERRYGALHKAAMAHVRRVLRRQGFSGNVPVKLVHTWELQGRGLLHVHVSLPHGGPVERIMAQEYVNYVGRHAWRYGFGWVDRKRKVYEAGKTAGYLSKYLTKSELAVVARAVYSVVYVTRKLTTETGVTMRALRQARWLWVCVREGLPFPRSWSYETIALLDRLCPIATVPLRGPPAPAT